MASTPKPAEPSTNSILKHLLLYCRRGLYGGSQASIWASIGWVLFLIFLAFIAQPIGTLISLGAGVILHLLHVLWEHGEHFWLGTEHEKRGDHSAPNGSPSTSPGALAPLWKWQRIGLWMFGSVGVFALIEEAKEYFHIFLASVLILFPAGVILTIAVLLFSDLRRKLWPTENTLEDLVTESLFRVVLAIPLSVLTASFIAGATSLLLFIMVEPQQSGHFVSLLWWWVSASFVCIVAAPRAFLGAFKFIVLRAFIGALISIALLVVFWIVSTHVALGRLNAASNDFELSRTAENRRHYSKIDYFEARERPNIAERIEGFIWSQFDPRHFLDTVGDPFVPASFSFQAESLASHEPHGATSPRVGKVQTFIRWMAKGCGCPDSLSPAEEREVKETVYWMEKDDAELTVYAAYHGAFCKELRQGLKSGMLRSWFILMFFVLGIMEAAHSPVTETSGRKTLRAPALTILVVGVGVVLALGALFVRYGVPSELVVKPNSVELPDSGGDVKLEWSAHHWHRCEMWLDWNQWVKRLECPGPDQGLRIAPNSSPWPAYYTVTVEAIGWLSRQSSRVSIVVSPPSQAMRRDFHVLRSNESDSLCAMAVDESGSIYLAGSSTCTFSGKGTDSSDFYVAKYDSVRKHQWEVGYAKYPGTICCVAVDHAHNVYFGGSFYWQDKPCSRSGMGDYDTTVSRSSAYLQKVGPDGNELGGIVVIGADEDDELSGLAIDTAGNVYAAGTTKPVCVRDLGESIESDAFLVKYNSNLERLGMVQFGTNHDDVATGVAVDASSMVYVTGYTKGPLYLENEQAFLAQFDGHEFDGNNKPGRWARKYGALSEVDWAQFIVPGPAPVLPVLSVDPSEEGIIYVAGGTGNRSFLGKYKANGDNVWFRPSELIRGSAIAAEAGALYQASNSLISKHDGGNGNLQWAYQLDSLYDSRALLVGPIGLYVAGETIRTVDSKPGPASRHVFVGKLVPERAQSKQ